MTKAEYHKIIGSLRQKYQKGINDLYIWCSLAAESLNLALNDDSFLSSRDFAVPSKKQSKTVIRSKEQVSKIIANARDSELFDSVFSYLVAQGEAFFQDILFQTLLFDDKKLKTRVPGVDHIKTVTVNEIIDRRTRKELIESLIEKELISLFYAKPSAQFEYIEKVVDVVLDDSLKRKWLEIKATRDLIVHNSGMVNKLYLKKAGVEARASEGDKILVDKEYLESSMATMKSLIGKLCSHIQKNA